MKLTNTKKFIAAIVTVVLLVGVAVVGFDATVNKHPAYAAPNGIVGSNTELRGVWVPTVHNLAYPSKMGLSVSQLKNEADRILDNSKDLGFNVVFFQVRPSGDALYKSNLFPWSKFVTGTQGVAPEGGFDPLQYFIDGAHARGMELHAWLNPYRVTTAANEKSTLSANNPAVLHPELTVSHTDGKIYFNPGEPAARQLVVDSIKEVVDNYAVDGIHFDDYFYPDKYFKDEAAFVKYGSGFKNVGDFRRNNNDLLVREVQTMVKNSGKNIAFGISPFGIWANKSSSALGSNTKGSESYSLHYADTRKWVKEGYIDYIMPQIYWHIGFEIADYDILARWWCDVANGTNVKFYSGMAAYKTIGAAQGSPWVGGKEISKQMTYNRANSSIKGYAMYAYQSIIADKNLYQIIKTANNVNAQVTPPVNTQTATATVPDMKVVMDGVPVKLAAYNIDDNNYFKLRDVAFMMKDTSKRFEVTWLQDSQAINLLKNGAYTSVGGEMDLDKNLKDTTGTLSTAKIYLDKAKVDLKAYTIFDNNYFKLRDLGQTFDFATDWDNDSRTLYVKTNESYKPE